MSKTKVFAESFTKTISLLCRGTTCVLLFFLFTQKYVFFKALQVETEKFVFCSKRYSTNGCTVILNQYDKNQDASW